MKMLKFTFVVVLLVLGATGLRAQSLPVGTVAIEDYYRRLQLLGQIDTTVSFTIRPLFPSYLKKNAYFPDDNESGLDTASTWVSKNGKFKAVFLPFNMQTLGSSDHPYGWNDGPMIPANGLQAVVSGGVFMQYGPLTVQLKPELIAAGNAAFENLDKNHYDVFFARYYDIYNNIDLPMQFGRSLYGAAYWGQSSIRLNYKSMSVGVSTENLWWGPGIRNSLLMSNSAPGFAHFTLNTLKPINTPIGSFEGMLIGGSLKNSGFGPLSPNKDFFGTSLYVPKPNNWRYLSGLIITWQPKWIPGLFLGFDQSQQIYGKNLDGVKDYFPFFSTVKKVSAPNVPLQDRDQLSSMFARWLWPQEHAEIYFEYGRYNNTQDIEQQMLAPTSSRAYIFGLRKMLPFKQRPDESILIGLEVTQMQGTSFADNVAGKSWYVSQNIRQGYTHKGQSIGAGIGPGGNLQSVEVSWVKGLKKLGVQLERYVHDNDFYYYAFHDSRDYSRHWTDLSMVLNGEWNYKNFVFNANMRFINSMAYQWGVTQPGNDDAFEHQRNRFNFQLQTGMNYRF